mmetsp:Transcript_41836/g.63984  ORF Transcript_41836/g.63984 Transcript_41836/m.63984 type:complete len:124 (-) Transcript_41836:1861-2232(-)|eukprot:CAMPEP_0170496396 /NCGR_PEP_ID=MMETSP0208-20121228/21358_1 /TAXON_ID=197538 /ORGANISM="Strombidium inclinatum, Strain S3" /LENGTH=123 /DNA_ID=CAMNT_0010772929 /DNA_START=569 /DNA_END=940 /DNA_ORIENTATION=+
MDAFGLDASDPLIPLDKDVRLYKDTREKIKKRKIKTNLDLMEAFNETALRFIPLYKKRINQQEMMARYNMHLMRTAGIDAEKTGAVPPDTNILGNINNSASTLTESLAHDLKESKNIIDLKAD